MSQQTERPELLSTVASNTAQTHSSLYHLLCHAEKSMFPLVRAGLRSSRKFAGGFSTYLSQWGRRFAGSSRITPRIISPSQSCIREVRGSSRKSANTCGEVRGPPYKGAATRELLSTPEQDMPVGHRLVQPKGNNTMNTQHEKDPLAELIAQGPGSNSIYAAQHINGSWSVVLDLDGSYPSSGDAKAMVEFWREQISRTKTLDVYRGVDVPNAQAEKIKYTCDFCGLRIDADTGRIGIKYRDIQHAQDALRERAERERGELEANGGLPPMKTFAERQTDPNLRPAWWYVYHLQCDSRRGGGYEFPVKGADTYRGLLDWTFHIAAKGWLDETNWSEFIQKHALPRNGAA